MLLDSRIVAHLENQERKRKKNQIQLELWNQRGPGIKFSRSCCHQSQETKAIVSST